MAPAAPAMPGSTVRRPAVPVRPSVPPGMQLSYDPTGPIGALSPAPAGLPSTAATAPGAGTAPAAPATSGPTGRRPAVPVCPPMPPGMRLPYGPNGREWRKPPRPAGVVAEAGAGAEAATSPASGAATDPAPAPGGGPASAPEERPPLLVQAAPALPPRPVPPGPPVATADWPLVSDVFQPAHPQDVNGSHAVWRSFPKFAKAA